ncbi:UNVERIFIED_CONTAM: hypothetical protein K2H54_004562 [Gekko kuhli]
MQALKRGATLSCLRPEAAGSCGDPSSATQTRPNPWSAASPGHVISRSSTASPPEAAPPPFPRWRPPPGTVQGTRRGSPPAAVRGGRKDCAMSDWSRGGGHNALLCETPRRQKLSTPGKEWGCSLSFPDTLVPLLSPQRDGER